MSQPKWTTPPILLGFLKLQRFIELSKRNDLNAKLDSLKTILDRQVSKVKKQNG